MEYIIYDLLDFQVTLVAAHHSWLIILAIFIENRTATADMPFNMFDCLVLYRTFEIIGPIPVS